MQVVKSKVHIWKRKTEAYINQLSLPIGDHTNEPNSMSLVSTDVQQMLTKGRPGFIQYFISSVGVEQGVVV